MDEPFGALDNSRARTCRGPVAPRSLSPHGRGLGALFQSGATNGDHLPTFAVLIALAALGILLYYAGVALERTFAGWAEREAT